MRYQTLWFRNGLAYLPSIGAPPSGMFFEVDPVNAFEPTLESLAEVLDRALPAQPQPLRERSRYGGDWPKQSVVQTAAGYRSWASFAKGSLRIALIETREGWQVSVGEGPSSDDVENRLLDSGASTRDIATVIMEIIAPRPIWKSSAKKPTAREIP